MEMQNYKKSFMVQEKTLEVGHQKRWTSLMTTLSGVLMAGMLASCGGGGSTSEPTMFSGTVAVGAALVGVSVEAACVGAVARSAPTDSNGQYSISTTLNLPCTLSATDPSTGYTFRSLASSRGIANVTPLTDLVFQMANGDHAKQLEATTQAGSLLKNLGIAINDDPTTSKFFPDETGLDKAILDFARIARNSNSNPAQPYSGIQQLIARSQDPSCLAATRLRSSSIGVAPLTGAGSTQLAPGYFEVCPRLSAETSLRERLRAYNTEDSQRLIDFFNSVMDEVGGVATLAIRPAATQDMTDIVQSTMDTAEALVPYLLAEAIYRMDSRVLRIVMGTQSGKVAARQLKTAMLNNFKPDLTRAGLLQGSMKALGGVFIDWVQENSLEYVSNQAYNTNAEISERVGWGVGFGLLAWGLEWSVNTAIDCFFDPKLCKFWAFGNAAATTFSWLAKDVAIFIDATKIINNTNINATRVSVGDELNKQREELRDPNLFGLVTWAKTGLLDGHQSTVTQIITSYRSDINRRIQMGMSSAICTSAWGYLYGTGEVLCDDVLTQAEVTEENVKQQRRINRMEQMWLANMSACKYFVTTSGEVGISYCLNLLNNNNAAPLSCASGQKLKNGQCIAPPVVLNIQPSSAPLAQTTTFTITGTDFPATVVASIADAICGNPFEATTTSFKISCKLAGSAGAKTVTVKTDTNANNGEIIDITKVVTATAALAGVAHPSNGYRYEAITCGAWAECRTAATVRGAQLVTIQSAALNTWLLDTFRLQASTGNGFWIGLYQGASGLAWASGSAVSFTNWNVNEPNNFAAGATMGNAGAHMYATSSGTSVAGKWNDVSTSIGLNATGKAIIEYAP
jgi:hypothetical protein